MRYAVSVDGAMPPTNYRYDRTIAVRCKPADAATVHFRADEEDWLDLLRAVHVADLFCHRGKNEDWNRDIILALPLHDPSLVTH